MLMNCKYIYKNKIFNSEIELNDFLLEKYKYESEFKDLVFLKTTDQLSGVSLIRKANDLAKEKKKQYDKELKKSYTEDGVRVDLVPPYMGVNEFLDGFTNSDNKLFYPKFIEFEYWRRRFLAWSEGDYTDDEKEVFGFDENNAPKLNINPELKTFFLNPNLTEKELNEKLKDITTKEEQELRDKMEFKWKNQALFGDVIHFIGQRLFSQVDPKSKEDVMWIDVVDSQKKSFLDTIDPKKYDADLQPIRKQFTEKQINQAIEYFKSLKNKLEEVLGESDLSFIPEPGALGDLNAEHKGVKHLLGRIDLLVIDSRGNAHVIDYKTSPKPYSKYNEAKKLGYTYQLSTYNRILAQKGFQYNNMRSFIAPIQLEGFRLDQDQYLFDNIKYDRLIDELSNDIKTNEKIINNLNEVISIPENLTATSENLIANVDKHMKIFFPDSGKKKSEEEIKNLIEQQDGFKKRTDLEKPYAYFPNDYSNTPILANSEPELVKRVTAYYNTFQEQIKGHTITIKDALKYGIKNNTSDIQLPESSNKENAAWLRNTLSKYLNNNWVVLEGEGFDSAEEFGVIFLQNIHTKNVEILTTSINLLHNDQSKDPKMKNLTYGLGESDIIENSKVNSKMLKATKGNIRLMETLLVLNNMNFTGDLNISQIQVINPKRNIGTWATNEELLYSFNKLMDLAKQQGKDIGENKLKDGKGNIKFATKSQLVLSSLKNILNISGNVSEKFNGMAQTIGALESGIRLGNVYEILTQLEELRQLIENDRELSRYIKNPNSIINQPLHVRETMTVYAQILWAIAEYKGYQYTQQVKDHKFSIGWTEGLYWQAGENPGNYASNILNTSSRVMQEAYQNVRDILSKEFRQITIAVDKLKEKEGFSKFKEYTYGNQSSLYKDIVYVTNDKDLMIKNPWSTDWLMGDAKREFTKMFLMKINKDRYPNKSEIELEGMAKSGDYDFFKCPLIKASKSGKAVQKSIFERFKTKIKRFFDVEYYKDNISNFLNSKEESDYKKDEEIFKMNNMMDIGNSSGRKSFIAQQLSKDSAYFEIDLENILMIHTQAYVLQREMDARMPIIKAAAFSLKMMGDYQGVDFDFDYETIEKTVKQKIKNESAIEGEKMKVLAGVTKELQQMASFMALAFAPIQASGQTLNGLFTNIKLNWTSDREIFSKENLISSFKEVGKDLVHFGTTPTLCEAINRVFGINDMDMNTYAQNLSSNRHGIFHFFDRYAFKMSSRPDFYNRMTIFLSQMKADGCYEAHSLNDDGTLKYECKKDKRYAALWTHPKGSKEYNAALSKYIPAAQQFVKEGAKNSDGSLFEFDANNPKELPRAYTVQEAESRKDVADSLYGYYDHTKKALFFGEYLGSLLGQMRTYWSAKKNQYLGVKGGNTIKGRQVPVKNDKGEIMYYAMKENGEIDVNAPFITKEQGGLIEVTQWQGDYSEGVFVTLTGILKEIWNNDDKSLGGILDTVKEKFTENPDENYRRCYVSNLKIAAYDLCMAIILGLLCSGLKLVYDDLEDDAKKSKDLEDVVFANTFGLVYKSFNYAKLDFFWWDSIFSPTIDWNPFVISSIRNTVEQVAGFVTGEKNAFAAMGNMFGFARQNKPLFRYLAQQTEIFDEE